MSQRFSWCGQHRVYTLPWQNYVHSGNFAIVTLDEILSLFPELGQKQFSQLQIVNLTDGMPVQPLLDRQFGPVAYKCQPNSTFSIAGCWHIQSRFESFDTSRGSNLGSLSSFQHQQQQSQQQQPWVPISWNQTRLYDQLATLLDQQNPGLNHRLCQQRQQQLNDQTHFVWFEQTQLENQQQSRLEFQQLIAQQNYIQQQQQLQQQQQHQRQQTESQLISHPRMDPNQLLLTSEYQPCLPPAPSQSPQPPPVLRGPQEILTTWSQNNITNPSNQVAAVVSSSSTTTTQSSPLSSIIYQSHLENLQMVLTQEQQLRNQREYQRRLQHQIQQHHQQQSNQYPSSSLQSEQSSFTTPSEQSPEGTTTESSTEDETDGGNTGQDFIHEEEQDERNEHLGQGSGTVEETEERNRMEEFNIHQDDNDDEVERNIGQVHVLCNENVREENFDGEEEEEKNEDEVTSPSSIVSSSSISFWPPPPLLQPTVPSPELPSNVANQWLLRRLEEQERIMID